MKNKVLLAFSCLAIAFSLFGCKEKEDVQETKENSGTVNPEVRQVTDINDIKVEDSKTIYDTDDDLSVICMYLTVTKGNTTDSTDHTWSEVNDHSVYFYEEQGIDRYAVNGMLQVGDETGPTPGQFGYGEFAPNATVTIRGRTSSRSPQKNYKIKINDNEGYWRGQTTIDLNKHVYDITRFRNKLSYDLIKTIPNMIGARTQFVHLYVKNQTGDGGDNPMFEDYGLFTQVEQINKTYLRNHGLDEFGQLYKPSMFEFKRYEDEIKLSDDPNYDKSQFETRLEIKGSDDHAKVIAMLDAVNDFSTPIEDIFPKYFDEDNYFTWLAFHIITGNRDTTSQNFFLYSPLNSQKFYFISWDNDGAWRYNQNVRYSGLTGYNFEYGVANYYGSTLHQRILKSEKYRAMLDEKMEYLHSILTKERINTMVQNYANVTRPYNFKLPDQLNFPGNPEKFETVVQYTADDIESCYNMYKLSLRKPMPFFLSYPESTGTGLIFQWDTAYDFNNEKIVYNFDLSNDYQFKTTIRSETNLEVPQVLTDALAPGQYFYRVTCTNESGETQTAMEIYDGADEQSHYGVLSFTVAPDGTIIKEEE